MKWLWVNKKNEESDEKYLCYYNELQFQIENEVNKIDKIQIMFFYCDLNELICRKICKQFELLTTKKNIIILIKKLWSNLFFYKQQTVQFYQKKFKLHNKKNERSVIKLNKKLINNKKNHFIKCFNYNRSDYLMKNCQFVRRKTTSMNFTNKESSQSSHRAYNIFQKNKSTNKKIKDKNKLVKKNSFKKKFL